MALRAIRIARGGKFNRSPMVGVTRSARGRECLSRVMHSPVMAGQAFLVDYFFIVKTKRGYVARGTLFGENRMRGRQIPGGVDAAVAAKAEPRDAQNCEN
jgi:hypothetical protein